MKTRAMDEALTRVREALDIDSGGNVEELEQALVELYDLGDPGCIEPLLLMLDDSSDYVAVLHNIVQVVEAFPLQIYIDRLLRILPRLATTSPFWSGILLKRILGSDQHLEHLLAFASTHKQAVQGALRDVAEALAEKNPNLQEKCRLVIDAVRGAVK